MLIEQGVLGRKTLAGRVAVVTGAGGGIGYEASRALLWLGAQVVVAEIDKRNGKGAVARLANEWGKRSAMFVETDVGDERSVERLAKQVMREYGRVDVVINNATVAPLGAVTDTPIGAWDLSYRVNLRGPVLLARAFLPAMVARGWGVFACVSSVGMAYMGAYESIKAAQVHLANTLDAELADSGVVALTIAPGFVPTETALASIPRLAEMMGIGMDEMQRMIQGATISVEAAGVGFAAAVALAERYRGQEISSLQALHDAGIDLSTKSGAAGAVLTPEQVQAALELCRRVRTTLAEQAEGWKERTIFERQWMIRNFRNHAGMPVEAWVETLERLEGALETGDPLALAAVDVPLPSLAHYYEELYQAARGYANEPQQREEQLRVVQGWRDEVVRLQELLEP